MSGRITPSHLPQRGGYSSAGMSTCEGLSPQRMQVYESALPCSSMTFSLPARWCRLSTFWVITANSTSVRQSSISASTKCAGFGTASTMTARSRSWKRQKAAGSRSSTPLVATSSGR